MTLDQFEVIATLISSREPAKSAARRVLVDRIENIDAATEFQISRQSVSSVSEQRVLSGDLVYGGFERIDPEDERFVLLAMHRKLLQRGLCARELTEKDVLLVFPSYYKKSRPALTGHPAVLVSYLFEGITDELYSTLVVQLDYSNTCLHFVMRKINLPKHSD